MLVLKHVSCLNNNVYTEKYYHNPYRNLRMGGGNPKNKKSYWRG